jgi:glycosyltransferase involved in cell wall biosynthesis
LADCRYFHLPYVAAGYAHAEAWVEAFFAGTVPRPAPALVPVKALGGADVLFNPGDYWSHETYARSLRDLMQASNIRLALLVHDLFATYRRDWSHPVFGPHIEEQFNLLAPHVDCWLATSQYVRTSIQTHLQALNLPEPPVNVLPLGQARVGNQAAMDIRSRAQLLARLGVPNTYILCVGTIEPRKNLAALLDALRDLRTDRSIDVPHCVLVGRDGWKSQGLKRRLRATDYEDRTVTWLRNLSDIELGALYDGACFTVLPSHGEGWGLSIGESIAHGVPWVATNVGGTVEAGTAGGIHFDPADPAGLKEALRLFIQDPSALQQAHEALRTAQSSRPSWDTTGQLLLEALLR